MSVPIDVESSVAFGITGLNLRDAPLVVGPTGLTDSLNWRLDARGALVKRLGYVKYPASSELAAIPLEQSTYTPSTGGNALIFYCANGKVYSSPGDGAYTQIATGLSTSAIPSFAQMIDKLYWSNGVDAVQSWDGSSLVAITGINDVQTITITGVPTGGTTTLTFNGSSTTALAYNATATNVHDALVLLPSIGTGNVTVTGGPWPGTGIAITFVNTMANTAEPLITTTDALTGGSAPATHVAHTTTGRGDAPKGKYLAVWRNRLWVAGTTTNPNRVYWSGIGDPTAWPALNYVDILGPRGDVITALYSSPNIGSSSDGNDGVLVFKTTSVSRVIDDSDNNPATAVISGGANVLVDAVTGTVNSRTVVGLEGRVYCAGKNGIYSTDGHTALVLESAQLGLLFGQALAQTQATNMTAVRWQNNYLLACTPVGSTANTLVLELYPTLGRVGDSPIMALGLPVKAWSVYPGASGDQLYFCDNSQTPSDNRKWVRLMWSGGSDTDGASTTMNITASARSGASLFNSVQEKRLRYIQAVGRGQLTVGAATDFDTGGGDQQTFISGGTSGALPLWNQVTWNQFVWPGLGSVGVQPITRYYGTRGRYFTFVVSETSMDVAQAAPALGITPAASGGAALYSMICKFTPLAGEV